MEGLDDQRVKEDCPWLEGRIVDESVLAQPKAIQLRPEEDSASRWKKVAQQVKGFMKEHGVDKEAVAVDYLTTYLIRALEAEGLKVVDGNSWILEADEVKTPAEIELMRHAASCNEAGYARLVREFRPGMKENEAQAIMARGIYDAGADYIEGWVVNSGPRTSPRSFNWSDRTTRPGEFMTLEACHVTYCGYKVCYDRTFLLGGPPTDIQKELYESVVALHHTAMKLLKPGISTDDVVKLRPFPHKKLKTAEDIRQDRSAGTWFSNHFGGMGIRWDDAPQATWGNPPRVLAPNMTFAYHAIFAAEGYEGVAVENTYLITENGCESLCKWPWETLTIIPY